MKKETVLKVFAVLFTLIGLRLLREISDGASAMDQTLGRFVFFAVIIVSFILAEALWHQRRQAFRWYLTWVCLSLGGQAMLQLASDPGSALKLCAWLLCLGAVYGTLGVYLRARLRPAL